MRFALPDDPDLDAFASGNEEVDAYFRTRQWFNVAKGVSAPPTYQFLTEVDGEVVGYASVAFRKSDHPFDGADERALYLLIYVIGVHTRFQGQRNPKGSNESCAASMFLMLANLARARDGCVGLGLWVREDNERAIAFYRKAGFEPDPGGAMQRDGGVPHLTMRALLASCTGWSSGRGGSSSSVPNSDTPSSRISKQLWRALMPGEAEALDLVSPDSEHVLHPEELYRPHFASFSNAAAWTSATRNDASRTRSARASRSGRMMSASPSVLTSSSVSLSMRSSSSTGLSMMSPRLFPTTLNFFCMGTS